MLVARGILRLRKGAKGSAGESHLSNFLDSAGLLETGLYLVDLHARGLRRTNPILASAKFLGCTIVAQMLSNSGSLHENGTFAPERNLLSPNTRLEKGEFPKPLHWVASSKTVNGINK
jgi:hypothetical protein